MRSWNPHPLPPPELLPVAAAAKTEDRDEDNTFEPSPIDPEKEPVHIHQTAAPENLTPDNSDADLDSPFDPGPIDPEKEPDLYPPDPHDKWAAVNREARQNEDPDGSPCNVPIRLYKRQLPMKIDADASLKLTRGNCTKLTCFFLENQSMESVSVQEPITTGLFSH
ncbi:hypothetical protein AAES_28303 [Amazona aestiva]|uniref:Uncharacterized protein n=1 Tax=Amazona aestiva TaxID=12930 RepID=A0A0Q3WD88_AMAAE|nr:hypothetical protein AAES_28303 [Amazona aestiva]